MIDTPRQLIPRLSPLVVVVVAVMLLMSPVWAQTSPAATTPPQTAATPKPVVVTVEQYRKDLEKAVSALEKMKRTPPRDLTPILKSLNKTVQVKRRDGQIQTATGDQWGRRLNPAPAGGMPVFPTPATSPSPSTKTATIDEVDDLKQTVKVRIEALDAWDRSSYSPADAQAVIRQLEGSGQIRTGPTALQQMVADVSKWFKTQFQNFFAWISSLFPSNPNVGKLPHIDPIWIQVLFYAAVFALLALLAYLAWKALGGRMGRRGVKRGVFAEGEDAELLLLPPDELRLRASQFALEGNFREALRHLYIALLLGLDARGVWRYDARRTNWEHIAALRGDEARSGLVQPLSSITRTFDRVRYGDAPFDANDWNRFESEVKGVEAQNSP